MLHLTRLLYVVALALAVAALVPATASAVTNTFTGGGSPDPNDWHNPDNWSGGVPTATEDVVIPADDPDSNFDETLVDVLSADAVARSIDARGTGLNIVNGHTLTIGEGQSFLSTPIQMTSASRLRLNGATNWAGGNWLVDEAIVENAGTLTVTGDPLMAANAGKSKFRNLTGATINRTTSGGAAHIRGLDNDGAVSVQTGKLIVDDTPSATQSAGSFTVAAAATLEFGPHPFSLGATASVTGAGTARFHATSGVTTIASRATYDVGTTDFNDGTLNLGGAGSTGRLIASNIGTRRGAGTLSVGTGASSIGSMTFRDGLTQFAAGSTVSASSPLSVIQGGSVRLGGTTTWSAGGWAIGDSGGGVVENAGTLNVTGNVSASGDGELRNVATGSLNRTTAAGPVGLAGLDNDGAVSVQTGRIDLTRPAAGQSTGSFTVGSGALLQFGGGSGGYSLGPTASIAGAGTARFADQRTTSLATGATYDVNTTEIESGTLALDTLTLGSGDVLRGANSGAVASDVVNSAGTVTPGFSPGTLTISGDYTQGAGGRLVTEVDGAAPGSGFDRLNVGGAASLNGTLQIVNGAAHDPAVGSTFKVVQSASRTGAFDTLTGEDISPSRRYVADYQADGMTLEVGQNVVVGDCDDPAVTGLTEVSGDLIFDGVPGCDGVSLPDLTQVGGDLVIRDLADTNTFNIGDLTTVGGDLTVTNNGSVEAVSFPSLAQTTGDLTITDNGSVDGVSFPSFGETTGDLTITENGTVGNVTFPTLSETSGDLSITGNGPDSVVDVGSVTNVGGDLQLESSGDVDLGDADVAGDMTLLGNGSNEVTATTPGGVTDVSVRRGTASMHVTLPDGTFSQPVKFTIERGSDGPPENGAGAGDEPRTIDPIAGYKFTFQVPTLGQEAQLDFTVDLSQLSPQTRAALLAGVNDGSAALAVKGDGAAATYKAFPRCGAGQSPEPEGCVEIAVLGSGGQPAGGSVAPAFVRFRGVAGHFSTYSVALIKRRPRHAGPGPAGPGPSPGPGPRPPGGPAGFGSRTLVSLKLASKRIPARGPVRVRVTNANGFGVTGRLTGRTVKRVGKRRVALPGKNFRAAANRATTVKVKLSRPLRRALVRQRRLSLRLTATVRDPAGGRRSVSARVTPRLKRSR